MVMDHQCGDASYLAAYSTPPDNTWIDTFDNGLVMWTSLRNKTSNDVVSSVSSSSSSTFPKFGSKVIISILTRLYHEDEDPANFRTIHESTGEVIEHESGSPKPIWIGECDFTPGLDIVLPFVKLHNKTRAIIRPAYAYGELGYAEIGIPPNATLDVCIELLAIECDAQSGSDEMRTLATRQWFGSRKRQRGDFWLHRDRYAAAIKCYLRANLFLMPTKTERLLLEQWQKNRKKMSTSNDNDVMIDDDDDDDEKRNKMRALEMMHQTRVHIFFSLASAYERTTPSREELNRLANKSLAVCLELDPRYAPALALRAKIRAKMGLMVEAMQDLAQGATIAPEHPLVVQLMKQFGHMPCSSNDKDEAARRGLQNEEKK